MGPVAHTLSSPQGDHTATRQRVLAARRFLGPVGHPISPKRCRTAARQGVKAARRFLDPVSINDWGAAHPQFLVCSPPVLGSGRPSGEGTSHCGPATPLDRPPAILGIQSAGSCGRLRNISNVVLDVFRLGHGCTMPPLFRARLAFWKRIASVLTSMIEPHQVLLLRSQSKNFHRRK